MNTTTFGTMAEPHIIHKILNQYWGFDNFRTLQEEIILSVLQGKDTLALLPTGGGKSICFQVPALAMEGICIVISPLISLMQDQVENLLKKRIKAVSITSANSKREIDVLLDNCIYGGVKFLYLSPERLKSDLFVERLKLMNVSLLAIDEAHCISQWGYDFRPNYLLISEVREILPGTPIIALTATATPEVVEDIQTKLEFSKKNVFQKSFVRENLAYVVQYEESKLNRLLKVIDKVGGSGIVYVRSRNKTGLIARELKSRGISCESYHAGLRQDTRKKRQLDWIEGNVQAIAATNAFGMGIDKPNVRWVVHLDLPDSPEAYFQEAGRAGRDGKKAYAVTLYDEADIEELTSRIEASFPKISEIKRVYKALGNYLQIPIQGGKEQDFPFDLVLFAKRYNLSTREAYTALSILENEGYISLSESIHQPSRVKILLDKKGVYHLSVQHGANGQLLDVLLRSYSGMFDAHVPVNENILANRLNWKGDKVEETLQKMHKSNSISFLPRNDTPKIYFPEERMADSNLAIDTKRYNFRKKRAIEKANSMIAYLKSSRCRSAELVAYFGENESVTCGVCDVCLANKRMEENLTLIEVVDLIRVELKSNTISVQQLRKRLSRVNESQFYMAIDWLEDAQEIVIEQENILLP